MDEEGKNEHSREENDKTRDNPDESDSVDYYLESIYQFFDKNLRIVFGMPPRNCSKDD